MSRKNPYLTLINLLSHPEFLENKIWCKKTYSANQTVIVEGEEHQQIYVVLSGSLMVSTDVEIASSKPISSGIFELFSGEEFGHFCFFDNHPHCASVKATSECELAVVDVEKLKMFFNEHPDIGYSIVQSWMKNILPRLRQSNKRIASLFSWGLKAHQIDKELA